MRTNECGFMGLRMSSHPILGRATAGQDALDIDTTRTPLKLNSYHLFQMLGPRLRLSPACHTNHVQAEVQPLVDRVQLCAIEYVLQLFTIAGSQFTNPTASASWFKSRSSMACLARSVDTDHVFSFQTSWCLRSLRS
jgi:hypothetical protein